MAVSPNRAYDVIVIGGGSAGLAAAVAARRAGGRRVLVIEREEYLGGVLPQCVHDGFGLHLYGESLTGPEYAARWVTAAHECGVESACSSTVLAISRVDEGSFCVDAVGASLGGRVALFAKSVVVATGCRERTRGSLQIPGGRPAGVLTAGSAQYMMNVANQMPGTKAVVLGSGDIGLIMARRLTLEGAEVKLVLGQKATGLVRNRIRCIDDFGIPLRYGWELVSISGFGQLQGVTVAPIGKDGAPDLSQKEYIRCNLLLVACGLVPEREVLAESGLHGDEEGLFLCGNAKVPHDLVDQVTQEGLLAGCAAAQWACAGNSSAASPAAPAVELPDDLAQLAARRIREPKGRECESLAGESARRIVCTECPTGCVMSVVEGGEISGNACPRGVDYAQRELSCPMRLFTGTVKLEGDHGGRVLLPVKTLAPVPKASLSLVARATRHIVATAPVHVGDVVCEDVAGVGVALVSCADCDSALPARQVSYGS